jgi:hypothetical protein
LIGELLLVALLRPTFGETSMAININKARITIEAPKYLFNWFYTRLMTPYKASLTVDCPADKKW